MLLSDCQLVSFLQSQLSDSLSDMSFIIDQVLYKSGRKHHQSLDPTQKNTNNMVQIQNKLHFILLLITLMDFAL